MAKAILNFFRDFCPEKKEKEKLDEKGEEEGRSPLYDPYILEHIFSYLVVSDLKTCRLVSTPWYLEATKHLTRRSVVLIETHKKLKHYVRTIIPLRKQHQQQQSDITAIDFTSILTLNNVHLSVSKLIEWTGGGNVAKLKDSVPDFIANHGACIKILTLDLARTPDSQLRRILQSTALVNLQKIIVKSEASVSGTGSVCWKYKFARFPSVTELEIAEHKTRYRRCSRDRTGVLVSCYPRYLDDLIKVLPNLKVLISLPPKSSFYFY